MLRDIRSKDIQKRDNGEKTIKRRQQRENNREGTMKRGYIGKKHREREHVEKRNIEKGYIGRRHIKKR